MVGWIIAALAAAVVVTALWETFAPFVKDILDRYVYRYFKCFVKYVRGKFFGEVELDGSRTYEKEIDESEVPEEFRWAKYTGYREDVTHNKELRMQLGL